MMLGNPNRVPGTGRGGIFNAGAGVAPDALMYNTGAMDVEPGIVAGDRSGFQKFSDRLNEFSETERGRNVENALMMLGSETPISGMMTDASDQMSGARGAQEQFQVGLVQDKYGGPSQVVGEYSFLTDDLYRPVDEADYQLDNEPNSGERARNVLGTAGKGAGSGAVLGSTVGGPVGGILGGAIGFVAGLFGGASKNKRASEEAKARQGRMKQAYLAQLEETRLRRENAARELNKKNQEKLAQRKLEERVARDEAIASSVSQQRAGIMDIAGSAVQRAGQMGVNQPTEYRMA